MEQLRAFWKWLASWTKREWTAADYPLRYREQRSGPDFESTHGTPPRWSVEVVNWWQIGGLGETRAEALADLDARLASLREGGALLPRPGRGLPLTFASSAIIEQHEELARDLLAEILDIDYDECFISDESSLFDFVGAESDARELAARIESHYQVELPEREKLLVSEILQAIAASRGAV